MLIKANKSFFKSTIILTTIFTTLSVFLDIILILLFTTEKNFFSDDSNILFLLLVLSYNYLCFYRLFLAIDYYKKTCIVINSEKLDITCLRPYKNKNIFESIVAPFKLPVHGLYELSNYSYKPKNYSITYKNIIKYGYANNLKIKGNKIEKDDIVILTKENKKEKQYIISSNQFKKDDLYLIIKELEKITKLLFNGDLSQFEVNL